MKDRVFIPISLYARYWKHREQQKFKAMGRLKEKKKK